jgi:hypothetical protein
LVLLSRPSADSFAVGQRQKYEAVAKQDFATNILNLLPGSLGHEEYRTAEAGELLIGIDWKTINAFQCEAKIKLLAPCFL